MNTIILSVDKRVVWDEVGKTASYTGAKGMADDAEVFERVMMTDEDQEALERFWEETASTATNLLKEMVVTASITAEAYNVELRVSNRYDEALNESVERSLRSYFIEAMTGRWFQLCDKEDVNSYLTEAASRMESMLRMLYNRKGPEPPKRKR